MGQSSAAKIKATAEGTKRELPSRRPDCSKIRLKK
jgi:hypothetical protein